MKRKGFVGAGWREGARHRPALARLGRVAAGIAVGLTILAAGSGEAAEVFQRSNVSVELGLSSWISQGETTWNHDASRVDPLLGNPTSKLTYKDVGTNVIEFSGKMKFARRWFVRANYGTAAIGGGRLTDDDFLAADGGNPSSRTFSDLPGDSIWYVNGDVGLTVVNYPGHRGTLDLVVGYQYRREKHEATGVTSVGCTPAGGGAGLCNPAGTVTNVGQPVITNTQTWNSLKLGVETEYRITRRLSVEGKAAFLPFTSLNNKDIHHLRTDLQQNPSFEMTGTGIGANLEGDVSYMVLKGLFLKVGYRYWWNRVSDGTWKNFPRTSPSETFNLNEFENIRQGLTFGATYLF